LLFSPRVYWRQIELQNEALWPLTLVTIAAGVVIVLALFRRPRRGEWIAVLLALLWALVGWSFVWSRYATINWAIAYVAPIFAAQAILLLAIAVMPGDLTFGRRDVAGWTGLMLAIVGLVFYPRLPLLSGRPWSSAELFGIAPDPTAIVTLGLLLAARGRWVAVLLPIPLLWCLIAGLTLWAMDDRQAWLPLLTVPIVLAASGLRSAVKRLTF